MCAPFHSHATLLAHPPPLHACRGALSPIPGSLSHPHFGAPTLLFAHHPACTSSPLHTRRGTLSPFCTPTLVHPPFCTLLFMRGSPTWVVPHLTCMPFACMQEHHGDGVGCTIPYSMCPLPLHVTLPLACIPPILLHPRHACKGEGHMGGAEWGA